MEAFTSQQLADLRSSYATIGDRISFDAADKLLALLDAVSPRQMRQLADAGIKFVSTAAKGRLLRGAK